MLEALSEVHMNAMKSFYLIHVKSFSFFNTLSYPISLSPV